jgi:DNA-binding MarR family transcriptional regulator
MSEADPVAGSESAAKVLRTLVTIRMIRLFILLRRGGILAQKRRFDLSEIEWRIMTQLGETAPLSLNGLAEALLQDRGQLSRAVKSMVARGLLTRERKPGGPEIEIELSDEGRALHGEMVGWVVERDERLTSGIDPADLDALWRVSDAMTRRASEMLEEEQRAGA